MYFCFSLFLPIFARKGRKYNWLEKSSRVVIFKDREFDFPSRLYSFCEDFQKKKKKIASLTLARRYFFWVRHTHSNYTFKSFHCIIASHHCTSYSAKSFSGILAPNLSANKYIIHVTPCNVENFYIIVLDM